MQSISQPTHAFTAVGPGAVSDSLCEVPSFVGPVTEICPNQEAPKAEAKSEAKAEPKAEAKKAAPAPAKAASNAKSRGVLVICI